MPQPQENGPKPTQSDSTKARRRRSSFGRRVGNHQVAYNKEATRWLGVYLDSSLTLKEHHRTRMRKARQAEGRLRRLTGQFGLTPDHCRRIQVVCVQASALFGSDSWWANGRGVKGQASDIQLMVNGGPDRPPVAASRPAPAHSWRRLAYDPPPHFWATDSGTSP